MPTAYAPSERTGRLSIVGYSCRPKCPTIPPGDYLTGQPRSEFTLPAPQHIATHQSAHNGFSNSDRSQRARAVCTAGFKQLRQLTISAHTDWHATLRSCPGAGAMDRRGAEEGPPKPNISDLSGVGSGRQGQGHAAADTQPGRECEELVDGRTRGYARGWRAGHDPALPKR